MRREFWCPLYRVFGGLPLAQFFRCSDLVLNWWGFVWNAFGMVVGGICSSLSAWEGVGADLGGLHRGDFAFLGTFDLFVTSCECSVVKRAFIHMLSMSEGVYLCAGRV